MRALLLLSLVIAGVAPAQLEAQDLEALTGRNVRVSKVTYRGKAAVRVDAEAGAANATSFALVPGVQFHDGTIEVELAGAPRANAGEGARGFIGVAFRIQGDRYEYIYLRPTNGRADDQVRRNHSTQYASYPDHDFARLRKESPEKYESYVDLEPGAWTKVRIVVSGTTARLFVHGAPQPCLVVNDLKLGDTTGGVAMWVGPGTEGHFTGLSIQPSTR